MGSELVGYEERDGIGYVTLNRPEVLNALNDDLIKRLREVLYELDDDANALVGIISGSGRAFCSGADIKQRQLRPKEELARLGSPQGRGAHIEDLFQRFTNWKPIIAAVHGYAIGGGLHMALMCEMIVAAEGPSSGYRRSPEVCGLRTSGKYCHIAQAAGSPPMSASRPVTGAQRRLISAASSTGWRRAAAT